MWALPKMGDKKNEKRENYLDLARGKKKLWNLKVTVILIITGVLRTVSKGFLRVLVLLEIGGQADTIQTIALLRSARILRAP